MDIRQLEAFVYVVKYSSFSKAADAIFLTQPTISAHINSLENELGVQLLFRSTKKVCPTNVGKDFFTYAQNILSLRDQAFRSVLGGGYENRGRIDILSSTVPAQYLLPEIITLFNKDYPKIVFYVSQADSRKVIEEMSGFQYDFGLIGTLSTDPQFSCMPIYDDILVVITPKNKQFNLEKIDDDLASFLANSTYVMREMGSGTRAEMTALLAHFEIATDRLHTAAYFSDNQSILNAVSHGLGISIVSKIAASEYVKQGLINMIEIDTPMFHRKFYLLTKNDLRMSPIQQAFSDYVRSYYSNSKATTQNR